jgi:hypothetical protein
MYNLLSEVAIRLDLGKLIFGFINQGKEILR